jgi:hypothetical protein
LDASRDLVLECLPKPSIVCGVGFLSHKSIFDRFVTLEDLPVHFALVVVPDLAARLGQYRFDRQQKPHLLRLEDAALRIDQRDTLAAKCEAYLRSAAVT